MMRFCSFMNEPNIPVRNLPFKEAWRQLLDFEEALDWPEECKTCEAAKVCQRCAVSLPGKTVSCASLRGEWLTRPQTTNIEISL